MSAPGMNASNMNGSAVDGHRAKRRKSWGSTNIRSNVGKQDAISRTMRDVEHFVAAMKKRLKNWACSHPCSYRRKMGKFSCPLRRQRSGHEIAEDKEGQEPKQDNEQREQEKNDP